MSLSGDIQEVKKLWKDASWPMKGVIALSLFLTTSSITSLSDVVFKWKGFILQAIQFYRAWVTLPLSNLACSVGLNHFSQLELDASVVLLIFVAANIRLQVPKPTRFAFYVVCVIIWLIGSGINSSDTSWVDLPYFVLLLAVFIVQGVITYKDSRADFTRAFGPVIVAIVVVVLLAALNAGIAKEIPAPH